MAKTAWTWEYVIAEDGAASAPDDAPEPSIIQAQAMRSEINVRFDMGDTPSDNSAVSNEMRRTTTESAENAESAEQRNELSRVRFSGRVLHDPEKRVR